MEPLAAMRETSGARSCQPELNRAWQLLLQNHAHDSICACSLDSVMDDIHGRLRQVDELCTIASERWLRQFAPLKPWKRSDRVGIQVINTLPGRGRLHLDQLVRVPGNLAPGRLLLQNANGDAVGTADVITHCRADLKPITPWMNIYYRSPVKALDLTVKIVTA